MRKLIPLRQDYILDVKFKSIEVKDPVTGYHRPDWTDETKTACNGRKNVERIEIHVPIYDREGFDVNVFQKVFLDKEDLLELAKLIKEIDEIKMTGQPGDDLPF